MIGQLSSVVVKNEVERLYSAVHNKGGKRLFDRFMARFLGVSQLVVGEVIQFQAALGEGKKASVYERMASLVTHDVDAAAPYLSHLEQVDRKRSPKYGTLTYQFRVKKVPLTGAEMRAFVGELSELCVGFAYVEHHSERFE